MTSYQSISDGRYDSIAAFLADVDKPAKNKGNSANAQDFTHGDACWDSDDLGGGCNTGDDVRRLVLAGWPDGRKRVEDFLRSIYGELPPPIDTRRRMVRGDHGDTLDIHAVYRGHIDRAWTRAARRAVVAQQHISVCVNACCHGGEPDSVLLWRGTAAIALADRLTESGYAVRLFVGNGSSTTRTAGKGEKVRLRIMVKDFDSPLNLGAMTAAMLPGFMRSLMLAWKLVHASAVLTRGIAAADGESNDPGEIYFTHGVRDQGSAKARVEKAIAELSAAEALPAA